MKNQTLIRILIILAVYLGLRYFGGTIGAKILYPFTLLVTYLHEFGHALGAILTGGKVNALQINSDGSGYTETVGGSRAVILMGGYIGSALLGNLLFYIGARKPRLSQFTINVLASLMIISAVIWFNSLFTTIILITFGLVLYFLANRTRFDQEILMFLGLASIIYIVQDFNVGPKSDLDNYANLFVFIPAAMWMYIWLGIVLLLCFLNLRIIFRK